MRQAARKDDNHDRIRQTFESGHCSVTTTHQLGGGFVDLVIGSAGVTIVSRLVTPLMVQRLLENLGLKPGDFTLHDGANLLIEVKDGNKPPSARRLTKDEEAWHGSWRGQKCIVDSEQQALEIIGIIKREGAC